MVKAVVFLYLAAKRNNGKSDLREDCYWRRENKSHRQPEEIARDYLLRNSRIITMTCCLGENWNSKGILIGKIMVSHRRFLLL